MTDPNRLWLFFDCFSKTQSNPVSTENAQLAILKMSEKDTERFFIWTAGWENWQPLKAYLASNQKVFFSSLQQALENNVPEETMTAYRSFKTTEREFLEMKPADKEVEEEVTKSVHTSLTKISVYSLVSLEEKDIEPSYDHDQISQYSGKFDGDDLTFSRTLKPKLNFKSLNLKNLKARPERHELKIEILLLTAKGKTFRSRSQNISMSGSLLENNIPFEYTERAFDIVVINTQPCDPRFQRVSLKARTVGQGFTQRIRFVGMTATQKKSLQNLLENYLSAQEESDKKAG